jgi:hypothetical protein
VTKRGASRDGRWGHESGAGDADAALARAGAGPVVERAPALVHDVTFDGDRLKYGVGTSCRSLMRRAGYANIAAASRRCAAQLALTLKFIGIEVEN